jgi:1,4-dihydroxy-2-naphthoyl-CoA hydrolase
MKKKTPPSSGRATPASEESTGARAVTFEFTVRLAQTDAAGVMFFARQFELAHLAYEQLLEHLGVPLPADLARSGTLLPIVHAEADYVAPLRLGDRVRVSVWLRSLGRRSFAIEYEFQRADGTPTGRAQTVHVALDAGRQRAVDLPEAIRRKLESLPVSGGRDSGPAGPGTSDRA